MDTPADGTARVPPHHEGPRVVLNGNALTVGELIALADGAAVPSVAPEARERAVRSWRTAQRLAAAGRLYGRGTGVGAQRSVAVDEDDEVAHGLRLLRSHAGGAGDLLPVRQVRAMLAIRANQLLAGGSGIQPAFVDALTEALRLRVHPAVNEYGGVGTGDLTALAQTALTLLGERPWAGEGLEDTTDLPEMTAVPAVPAVPETAAAPAMPEVSEAPAALAEPAVPVAVIAAGEVDGGAVAGGGSDAGVTDGAVGQVPVVVDVSTTGIGAPTGTALPVGPGASAGTAVPVAPGALTGGGAPADTAVPGVPAARITGGAQLSFVPAPLPAPPSEPVTRPERACVVSAPGRSHAPLQGRVPVPVVLRAGDALALLSSNALALAQAALAQGEAGMLLRATHAVAALSLVAVSGSPEAYAAPVHALRPYPGAAHAAGEVRRLLGLPGRPPPRPGGRVQDPFGFRAFPQVHGCALDASERLREIVEVEINCPSENPLMDPDGAAAYHHGGFFAAPLGLALDAAGLALLQTAQLSAARLTALGDPGLTGLPAFLGCGPASSSGAMILEYTANSALAELRSCATPASAGHAVLSRGLEEAASFAGQAARQALRAANAYRVVLACELVAAVRALRMLPGSPPVAAFAVAAAALPAGTDDRPLTDDVTAAGELLPLLARL
ncbi:aromatic amino acid ammonia-lyase [Streptomyces sp. NBC_00199]|uniref:aromatic amino acid ammonia-lyase n=1 Tax=Streptomyces sp. NBC_00199 TaxID=2975678 RepID=UPI0022511183|nr:aromatic amino acid ammonia-lyase [Streptomyces sp. NBC_00199]MCX5268145.1 aromatic amino acid ammonia-lyase [Streptomyces sp. NBC_00199]